MIALLEQLARIAPFGTFCIALAAILIAIKQLNTAKQNEAKKQFLAYRDDWIKYPDFMVGKYTVENQASYHGFMAKALMAHESIFEAIPDDKEWINITRLNLSYHGEYFVVFGEGGLRAYYSPIIAEICNDIRVKYLKSLDTVTGKIENDKTPY